MNIILLTPIIFSLAFVCSIPCQDEKNMRNHIDFIWKHILQYDFDTNSENAWKKYLKDNKLCGRAKVQSFIKEAGGNVLKICGSAGRRLRGNLCISRSTMVVYHVKSIKKQCKIRNVKRRKHHVIVACSKIGNHSLPVHYERYNKQKPGNIACT